MTATIPTPTLRIATSGSARSGSARSGSARSGSARSGSEQPHLIIIESPSDGRGDDETSSRGGGRPGLGMRVGGVLARIVSAVSIVALGLFAVIFTAVWVVVTVLVHAVGLGRSGRLRGSAPRRAPRRAPGHTPVATSPASTV